VSRAEFWARLRRSLWQPPRPHGEQPRANGSLHHELHGHDDARARSTFLLQILLLVAMAAFIPEADGERGAAFAVAAGVLFAVLAVLWLLAARGDRPQYRRTSGLFVTGTAACAIALAATALLPASARVLAWGLIDAAYLAGFAAVILTVAPTRAAAMTVTDSLTERFGAFIIIVLGETLTGVVGGLASQPVSALTMAVGLVAVVVGFGAWWTYFDFAGQRRPRPEPVPTVQWILGHLPLTAAVAAMGAAMVSLVDHAHDGRTPAATAWVLSAGAAVVLGTTMLVAVTLQAWEDKRGLYPGARPYQRRRGSSMPGRRRREAGAPRPRSRARSAAQHPLGIRRRAPPDRRCRISQITPYSSRFGSRVLTRGLACCDYGRCSWFR
jgi:low temperature requirement protein LtrA